MPSLSLRAAPCRVATRCRASRRVLTTASTASTRSLFIFGAGGYTARGLANTLLPLGWKVAGACRDERMSDALRSAAVDAHVWNPDDAQGLDAAGREALLSASHVLTTVPPVGDFRRDPVLLSQRDELQAAAEAMRSGGPLRWVGYLSSTGVYGDHGGEWVDETAALLSRDIKARARMEAEAEWMQLHESVGLPVHVFRLGGIYGPARSVEDAIRRELAAPGAAAEPSKRRRAGQRFINRIHVADVCHCLVASMAHATPGAVFNLVDDEPAPRAMVTAYTRQLLGAPTVRKAAEAAPAVRTGSWSEAAEAGGEALEEKRVRNAALKARLGVRLRYPTFREGMRAIVEGDERPFGASAAELASS